MSKMLDGRTFFRYVYPDDDTEPWEHKLTFKKGLMYDNGGKCAYRIKDGRIQVARRHDSHFVDAGYYFDGRTIQGFTEYE